MLIGGLLGGFLCATLFGLAFGVETVFYALSGWDMQGIWSIFGYNLFAGLMGGLGVGLPLGLGGGRGGSEPQQARAWNGISLRWILIVVLGYGIVTVLALGYTTSIWRFVFFYVFSNEFLRSPLLLTMAGVVVGLPLAFQRGLLSTLGKGQVNPQGPVNNVRKSRMAGFAAALAAGVVVASTAGVAVGAADLAYNATLAGHNIKVENPLKNALASGAIVGIIFWLAIGLGPRLTGRFVTALAEDEGSPGGPLARWHSDRMFRLVVGLVFGLVAGLALGLEFEHVFAGGLVKRYAYALPFGLTVGLVYGITSSVTWATTLAWRLQLQPSRHVPTVGLMSFLEDARDRDVLRTVGAVYQFRHATLQDQLAGQTIKSHATLVSQFSS
jgi:hypothetical protein